MLSNLENRDWNEILRADRTNFGSEDIEWFLFCWHRNRCRLMRIIGFHMPFFVCGFQHSSPWITDDINQLSFLTWSTSRYRVLRDLPTFGHIPNKSRSLGDIGKAACSVTPLPTCPLKCFVAIFLKIPEQNSHVLLCHSPSRHLQRLGVASSFTRAYYFWHSLYSTTWSPNRPVAQRNLKPFRQTLAGWWSIDRQPSLRQLSSIEYQKSLWETTISVTFVEAFAMCPSHLIEWSLEWLTSYSMRSNSYCSTLHSQKHTVRTQKRSHMLEEMEPERPLVWICLLIDLNGNILLGGQKCFIGSRQICCQLARISQRMPPIRKQKVKHLVDLQCIELCSYIYAQHKMILWQFSHIVQTVLVMAKWIIADCITSSWLWVNLCSSQCTHESEILSQVTQRLKGLQSQKVINRMLKMLAQCQYPSICCVPVKSWRVVEDCHRLFSCLNVICHKPDCSPKDSWHSSVICWRCLFGLFLSDLHSSSKCQVPLLQSLGRAQLWANALGVCSKNPNQVQLSRV